MVDSDAVMVCAVLEATLVETCRRRELMTARFQRRDQGAASPLCRPPAAPGRPAPSQPYPPGGAALHATPLVQQFQVKYNKSCSCYSGKLKMSKEYFIIISTPDVDEIMLWKTYQLSKEDLILDKSANNLNILKTAISISRS